MKTITIVGATLTLLLLIVESGNCEDLRDLSIFQLIKLAGDILFKSDGVYDHDVSFYLASRSNTKPVNLTSENLKLIDLTKPTKFIIHGWTENHRRTWFTDLTNEYLKKSDVNMIQVDWEKPARNRYSASARNSRFVGYLIANFIISLKLNPKTIHLIGHSFGSHAAGFAAKRIFQNTGQKVRRISALDPAGPLFRQFLNQPNERLSSNDADIVDAIHTDGGFIGYEFPIGTFDIFANGGTRIQPRCWINLFYIRSIGELAEEGYCSHGSSTWYFIDWINRGKFHCNMRDSYNITNQVRELTLSADDVTEQTKGICFARTNAQEPFLK